MIGKYYSLFYDYSQGSAISYVQAWAMGNKGEPSFVLDMGLPVKMLFSPEDGKHLWDIVF